MNAMICDVQLSFLRQLLKDMNISSCILANPSEIIPPQIDLHLRSHLFNLRNYVPFLQNPISMVKEKTLYRFFDEYSCNYIFLRLPEKESFFFIGPYLLSLPSSNWISGKLRELNLPQENAEWMRLYYASLPLIEDENLLLTMANTFARQLWGSQEQYTMEYTDYAIPDRYEPIPYETTSGQNVENRFDLTMLEQNYANENLLMEAVSKGKLQLITAMASTVFNNGAEQRLADSLRDRKNNLVILKTLLRKAAELGGVHPWHIHRLSSYFAERIENSRTIKQSLSLQEEMIRAYCQLVKRHSLSKYSHYVGQAITLVQYDLSADLSLKSIAERLNVNGSYLSRLFHQEYGCTLTQFINQQRIEHSIHLLQTTDKTVQVISADCGIQDVNYFIKLFKKQTGLTPVQFRQKNRI